MAADFGQFAIPKTAQVPSPASWAVAGGRWLFRASLAVGALSLLAAGGLFGYRRILVGQRSEWLSRVRAEEAVLQTPLSRELTDLSRSLSASREVLAQHVLATNVFGFLKEATHPQVQFTGFQFSHETLALDLSGVAASYRTVAEQISILESRGEVSAVDFGGLSRGPKGVLFQLSIEVKPILLSYRRAPPAPPLP